MKTQPFNLKLAFLSSLLFASSTVTAGTISQSPLFVTSSLDPNIMFIIDNSGSMNLSFVPNNLCLLRTSKRAYSYALNGLAYNPNVTYTVPRDSSGASLGNSDFEAAWKNGYAFPRPTNSPTAGGARVKLSTQYQPTFSTRGTGCNDETEYAGTAQAAYYYKFTPGISGCAAPGNINNDSCYTKITVGSTDDTTPGTTAEKKQNFANWYSYYRTRLLTTKAGASRAFAELDTSPRVGYGQLNSAPGYNLEGPSFSDTIVNGVRAFSGTTTGTARYKYFDWLFKLNGSGSTPSRRAIDTAGRYYSNEGEKGPWSTTPGTSGGSIYTCRQSYTIFMTDGYWNDATASTSGARANTDGSNGPTVTHANNADTYSYVAKSPFSDSRSNTLADVAMYYWKRDICPSTAMINNVPVSSKDPAFWQHMVLYGIGLGVPTQIDPTTAFNAIGSGAIINWPDPEVNNTDSGNPPVARIDDLLHASVNGHGGFFNANDTDSFVTALKSTLTAITDNSKTSASAAAANSSSLQGDTLLYVARFKPGEWYGTLTAFPIIKDPGSIRNGTIDVDNPNWEAADSLPPADERNIFTLNPGSTSSPRGIEFLWNNLNAAQKSALNKPNPSASADGNGEKRLNWLRGISTFEQRNSGGIFRNRSKLLGDIVNSDPAFVGSNDYGYHLLPDSEGAAYTSFRNNSEYQNRTPTIYVGANDGMLHAFDARKNTGSVTTGGTELFAYIPNHLFPELSKLTNPDYVHQYYVDGNTTVSDAYLGTATGWRSLLVGTTGAGGRALYALDVTYPDSFSAENVLWEFTNNNDSDLGYTLAQPSIVRTHDTSHPWMVIVGNGYNSDNGHAVLMMIDAQTGTLVKKIDTGYAGTGSNKNGLSSPLAVDIDGDKIVDAVYAGDLYGNFWKFDLTSTSSGDWDVAYKNASVNIPLFVACTTSGTSCDNANRQPITGKPNAGAVSSEQGNNGLMVYFGTGKYFENGDDSVSGTQQIQTFYGIWDNNVAVTNRAELQEQSIVFEGFPTTVEGVAASRKQRILSNNAVCYTTTSAGCSESSPLKKGWALNLLEGGVNANGERVVSYPLVRRGFVIFSSIIPDPDPCVGGGRGWLMEVGAFTGGRTNLSPFDVNGDGLVDEKDKVTSNNNPVATSGMDFGIGLHDTPAVVEDNTIRVDHKFASGSSGLGNVAEAGPPTTPTPTETPPPSASGRQAWRQLR